MASLRRNLPAAWDGGRFPEKVQSWHRDRLAVVYVRQSTAQQVLDHQESTRLQYGLTTRAVESGWATARVLVISKAAAKQTVFNKFIFSGGTPIFFWLSNSI